MRYFPPPVLTVEALTPRFAALMAATASVRVAPAATLMLPRDVPSLLRISIGQAGSTVRTSASGELHSVLLSTDCVLARLVTVMPAPGTAVDPALAVTAVLLEVTLRAALRLAAVRASAAAVTARKVVL